MLIILLIGVLVGAFGAMLGIGGGVILIPLLTVFFGVPIKIAIGSSILCVIATSSAAGAVYVGRGLTHNRLAMVLEIATTAGALAGGITAILINPRLLTFFFGLILIYVCISMHKLPKEDRASRETGILDASYVDPLTGSRVDYSVRRLPVGMGASFLAGNLSGLLGIGGGIIKVPVMSLVMGIPLRAAIATSNLMIGITAATSAIVYYARGYMNPAIAIPVALGVLVGAQAGTRLSGRIQSRRLGHAFQVLLIVFAIQMFYKALRG